MDTYTITFLSGDKETVEAQEIRLMGHEGQWTDFVHNPNRIVRRFRSAAIDRIVMG